MKIGFFQFAPARLRNDVNLAVVGNAILSVNFDLLVLPELFTSSYLFHDQQELINFSTAHPFHQVAAQLCPVLKIKGKKGYLAGTILEWPDPYGCRKNTTLQLVDINPTLANDKSNIMCEDLAAE